jgi:hypothetical protein
VQTGVGSQRDNVVPRFNCLVVDLGWPVYLLRHVARDDDVRLILPPVFRLEGGEVVIVGGAHIGAPSR